MNRVKRKNNPAFFGFMQYPGIQQGVDVSMDGFYVAAYPAGRLPNGQGSGAGHELVQIPAVSREHLKQEVRKAWGLDPWFSGRIYGEKTSCLRGRSF